ncbi:hypothetical protein BHE74_00044236 [Ensete ventricosum]|nr:hypothetical protein BHE74_00044236 [Ensete ventricosum]RZS17528.1 hypothetical protein BHM03_00049681 [Ensete ventricosum]
MTRECTSWSHRYRFPDYALPPQDVTPISRSSVSETTNRILPLCRRLPQQIGDCRHMWTTNRHEEREGWARGNGRHHTCVSMQQTAYRPASAGPAIWADVKLSFSLSLSVATDTCHDALLSLTDTCFSKFLAQLLNAGHGPPVQVVAWKTLLERMHCRKYPSIKCL